ncbi:MAG TPA: hypothetical protein VLI67_00495 [Vicinamibacteria bacterium]|nr:hypothetical protein [Vicinamibacteria bacterium]
MRWTRLSLFYLMSYLGLGGVGLLAAPDTALRLLGAREAYPAVLARFLGAFMLALAVVVVQIVRQRVESMYSATLMARTLLLATIVGLYLESGDPLFLVLTGIVGLGMLLTTVGFVSDRRRGRPPGKAS